LAGDKASKDGKKAQMVGKVGDTIGNKTATASKPVDVKKSHEADVTKSTAAVPEVRADTTLPDQGDVSLDDRSATFTCLLLLHVILYAHILSTSR